MNNEWARPGARCICVNGQASVIVGLGRLPMFDRGTFPERGRVYTIASVEWHDSIVPGIGSFLGVHVVEIQRPRGIASARVVPYRIDRFRPLVEKSAEEDLALFAPLLDSVRQAEPV